METEKETAQLYREKQYAKLERNFVKYSDLCRVVRLDSHADNESFSTIPVIGEGVVGKYSKIWNDMENSSPNIIVRESVYKKLCKADEALKRINSDWQLLVIYGYRSMDVQQRAFEAKYEELKDKYINQDELLEAVHRLIAVPEVAGHPTGGAVDVVIQNIKSHSMLDFGSEPLDFSTKKMYYASMEISKEAEKNRQLLRRLMGEQDFVPYDGEWWHFSYGDKEWAYYNHRKAARKKKGEADYRDIVYLYGKKDLFEITYTDKYRASSVEPTVCDVVRLAVQKSGRLTGETISLLERSGIDVVAEQDKFYGKCRNFPLELLFVRDDDIPNLVQAGVADIGVVGENVYIEQKCNCHKLLPLGFGRCSLALAVPNESPIKTVYDLSGKKIATSYRNSTMQFLNEMDVANVEIVEISGSVEIAPSIGYADAIVDLVSTGNSLRQSNLRYLQTIYESQSILIGNTHSLPVFKQETIDKLVQRFEGCLKAKKFKSLVFTCQADKVASIHQIEGKRIVIENKTAIDDAVSIQLVVEKNFMWDVIDTLKNIGIADIMVLDVEGFV
ncbi:MAG: ATP phosphoribosyltransferase [Lachnospiraceae bacterium]|jgi:ATP phosphoribosyltransferase|nr:ATP phosphoribosyltransferase [Lachnospiraceae bacterium]